MKKILIGSAAMKFWFPDFNREPKDIDYAVDVEGVKSERIEDKRIEYLYNPLVTQNYPIFNGYFTVANPIDLLTLKASHLFWDINWEKHMFDTQFLLGKGVSINEELFYKLYDYWNVFHGKNKRSDLKMEKEDFFDNAINPYMEVEHDVIHTFINPIPTYTKLLAKGKTVELDERKFYSLTEEEKDAMVIEEVMVMAYERYRKLGYRRAYHRMVKKFLISHAPMYLALHLIKHYRRLHLPQFNFIEAIDNGIREFKNKRN